MVVIPSPTTTSVMLLRHSFHGVSPISPSESVVKPKPPSFWPSIISAPEPSRLSMPSSLTHQFISVVPLDHVPESLTLTADSAFSVPCLVTTLTVTLAFPTPSAVITAFVPSALTETTLLLSEVHVTEGSAPAPTRTALRSAVSPLARLTCSGSILTAAFAPFTDTDALAEYSFPS